LIGLVEKILLHLKPHNDGKIKNLNKVKNLEMRE